MKYLVVVESPSKCAKVQNYLSKSFPKHSFTVLASVGHFTTLSKKKMGVDIKKNFAPNFIECKDKRKVINNLKSAAKKVDRVIIASDLDAEGEKIGFDVANLLGLDLNDNNRMIFNEITQSALKKAFEEPTTINMNLVHAQFARRILDRLIGFEISRITAKEIQRGVSAGRVLSVTTKIINEKEKELAKRVKDTFFQISGDFKNDKYYVMETIFKKQFKTEKQIDILFDEFQKTTYTISNSTTKEKNSSPPYPFITSTINQVSPYSIRQTSGILQKLYQRGFITYIRTDSTKMSEGAKEMIKKYITSNYGADMFQYRKFNHKKVKGAQEAHECIRPTKIDRKLEDIKDPLQRKIYELILKRSVAALMKDSKYMSKDVKIKPSNMNITFDKTINKYIYLGWRSLYTNLNEINRETEGFEHIKKGDKINDIEIRSVQKYNSMTGRYTESKLVNTLEKMGIGRPSTYATAVSNIQNKSYVMKGNIEGENVKSLFTFLKNNKITKKYQKETINSENNKLIITDLGKKTTRFLDEFFNVIMNFNFTSEVEKDLDKIQNGEVKWFKVVEKYYNQFHPQVETYKIKQKKEGKKNISNRLIGEYKGKNFYTLSSQYGPRVIYGEDNDKLYLTPIGNVLLSSITLEEAIALLPRTVGKFEGHDIVLHYSKSLYIKHKFKNIPLHWCCKNKSKTDITLDECIISVKEFREKKEKKAKRKSRKYEKKPKKIKTKSVTELKKEAKEKGIKGYSKMKKAELLKILQ